MIQPIAVTCELKGASARLVVIGIEGKERRARRRRRKMGIAVTDWVEEVKVRRNQAVQIMMTATDGNRPLEWELLLGRS